MSGVTIPKEWEELCVSTDFSVIRECINNVFRRLLANLLLDFHNPRYRQVKKENKALHRLTDSLPAAFVQYLFGALGFVEHHDTYQFEGSEETLKHADAIFSHLEILVDKEKLEDAERELSQLRHLVAQKSSRASHATTFSPPIVATLTTSTQRKAPAQRDQLDNQQEGIQKDVEEGKLVEVAVRQTLLNTGRIRNSFFEAKDVTIRTMRHGRVYACTEKCGNDCIEVHWHLITGKNMLYAHLAHLSPDGTQLLHLGVEHGYQYNSLPGSQHFGKTIHFSEKLAEKHGKLIHLRHDDKPVATCTYCGRAFSELLL
jgi:flagellin-specific chaperone FliS